jgi:hypothetical protein
MPRAEEYRQYAAECLALAQTAKSSDQKAMLLEMAQAWKALAEKLEVVGDASTDE